MNISMILSLHEERTPFVAAVLLLVALATAGILDSSGELPRVLAKGVWGGPALHARGAQSVSVAMASRPRLGMSPAHRAGERAAAQGVRLAALSAFGSAPGFSPRTEFATYKVARGDTFSGIAAKFGVSLETVLRANPDVKANRLAVGMALQIPPVSGTVYFTKEGETLESVADAFGVAAKDIADANRSVNVAMLGPGARPIIPGVLAARVRENGKPLPALKGYFMMPASGFNLGNLHPVNAVDIAGVCGTPVVAAAEGLAVPDAQYGEGSGGWNGGYGTFVLIEHPAGANVRTRYAHLKSASVDVGEYVKQGQEIGRMGDTGDAAGCHAHFEVLGAVNPFAK
ncbi:MAG: M23 family metallopeptidase [Candidatus Liptonbacteria bacterium]|nr:M23 family metallopeptidase [Candidatus Liptonbacteria bacterium]